MPENQPRVLQPFTPLSGPMATDKDFSMTPQRVDHRHPVTQDVPPAPQAAEDPQQDAAPETPSEAVRAAQAPEQAQDAPDPVSTPQEAVTDAQGIAPDAEPLPTPHTPTPRPDGQPPAPDAIVVANTRSENASVAVVNIPSEGSGSFTA